MSVLRRIDAAGLATAPWINGGGVTTEIDRDASAPWRWRLSLARIETDGPFSPLPGVRRHFAPLDAPLELSFDDATRAVRRLQSLAFDGEPAPHAQLTDGPTRAFNLMLRDGARGELIARPLLGSMLLLPQAGERWFVYLASGDARLHGASGTEAVTASDMAWIHSTAGQRLRLEGAGEIVLVRLSA